MRAPRATRCSPPPCRRPPTLTPRRWWHEERSEAERLRRAGCPATLSAAPTGWRRKVTKREPTEEEMRAALEAELKKVTVDDVLLQTAVSLINLGGRRAGLVPGAEGERDLEQVQVAIDGVGVLLPLLERRGRDEVRPLRDALAQLQMAYAQQAQAPAPSGGEPPA